MRVGQDMNVRFNVTAKDKVLALAALSFDLSVYDIFGLMATGGTLVMPGNHLRVLHYTSHVLFLRWCVLQLCCSCPRSDLHRPLTSLFLLFGVQTTTERGTQNTGSTYWKR